MRLRLIIGLVLVVSGVFLIPTSAHAEHGGGSPELLYVSPGDTNGLFHYYGSDRGTRPFQNPTVSPGLVTCSGGPYNNCQGATDRQDDIEAYQDSAGASFTYVLPAGDSLSPYNYTIRNKGGDGNHQLRSWIVQGFTNTDAAPTGEWITFDTQSNNTCLDNLYEWCEFTVTQNLSWEMFSLRIVSTGPSSSGGQTMGFQEIEFYGAMTDYQPGNTAHPTTLPGTTTTTTTPATTTTTNATTTTTTTTTAPVLTTAEDQLQTLKLGLGLLTFCAGFGLVLRASE